MKKNLSLLFVLFIVMVLMFHFSGCGQLNVSRLQANFHVKKAHRYYAEEMYKLAIEEYEAALKLNPHLKKIYIYLGTGYSSLYRPMKNDEKNKLYSKKAIDYLLKAKEWEPENHQITAALGDMYDRMGDTTAAEKCYLEILQNSSADPKSYYIMASFYAKNGKPDSAEQMYQKRIQLNPGDPEGYHYYVGFLQDQRRWSEAIENHEKRLYALLDSSIISILHKIAQLENQSDKSDTTSADEVDKKVEELKIQLRNKIRKAEATIASFEPAKKQEVAEVYYSIGNVCWIWSYQTQEIYMSVPERKAIIAKGLQNLKKATQIEPDYANPYAYIGLLYREMIKVEPLKREEFLKLNEEYNNKFTEIHKRKKKNEAYRKELEQLGK